MTLLHDPKNEESLTPPALKPFEPLSPVLVLPNAREIFAAHPEIEDLHQLPVDLFDAPILTDENLKNNGVSREDRRTNPPDSQQHLAAKRAVLSAAHVMSAVPQPSRQEAYRFVISEWEEDRGVQAQEQTYLRITLESLNIDDGVAYVTGLNDHGREVQQRTLELIQDSSANQYQLLKTLASVQSSEALADLDDQVYSQDMQALRWLTLLSLVRMDRQTAPVAELLAKRLTQGDFDRYIAHDMLGYANLYQAGGQLPEPVAALKSMISLVEHSAGASADGQTLSRMAEGFSLGMWPKEQQTAVYKQRKVLLDTLDYLTCTVVPEFVSGVIAVEGRDYKTHMYKAFDELSDIDTGSFVQAMRAVGGTAAGSLKRRRQPRTQEADIVDKPESDMPAEREPIPLAYVDKQGIMHAADTKEFDSLVHGYLDKHKNTPHLEEDLTKILDHLCRLDFSNGGVKGLIRVTNGYAPVIVNGDGPKSLPVWEFKPKDAPGLSLKSNAATRTRVYLSVLPDVEALAIRDIGRRSDSSARDLNRRTGRGRRRRSH